MTEILPQMVGVCLSSLRSRFQDWSIPHTAWWSTFSSSQHMGISSCKPFWLWPCISSRLLGKLDGSLATVVSVPELEEVKVPVDGS